jgi:hypothetical protein
VLPTFEVFGSIPVVLALVVASQAWCTRRVYHRLAYQATR